MALKDCIKKLGKAVSKQDVAQLEQFISDGLNDSQAVRKLLIGAHQNVIDIAGRARTEGAAVTPRPDVLVDITQMQTKNLEKIKAERDVLTAKIDELAEEEGEIGIVEDRVARKEFGGAVDLTDDQAVMTSLSGMLFGNKKLREEGVMGLQGKTPIELLESFRDLQIRKEDIAVELSKAMADLAELDDRVASIFSRRQRREFFQDVTKSQAKRGSISFDEQNKAIIRLTKSANLSTFLHESGHLYMEVLGDLSELPEAPQQTINDFQKILNYLGVENREQIGTEHHETWAKSFEAYLREGKAPSPELQRIFGAFRAWLVNIYRQLRNLNVLLTDDIRGVMDRLVATDVAITEAEQVQEFTPIFSSAEQMGISPEAFEVYRENVTKSHQDAVDKETSKMLASMDREAKAWWASERAQVREEVEEEVFGMRVYRALAMFQYGENPDGTTPEIAPMKLSKDDLVRRYGTEFIKRLPKPWVYSAKGGVDADIAAQTFGYESGDAMIQEMLRAGKRTALIEAETDARMKQRFPDPLIDGSLQTDAATSVFNEKRAQILAAELRALRKRMREDRPILAATRQAERRERAAAAATMPKRGELASIKAAANAHISGMRIRDVKPHKYRLAAQKAGRKAFEAAAKGNYQVAYAEKLKQIRAHELFRAATRAKEESARTTKYLRKFESVRVQRKLGKSGMLDRILAVLEGMDFRGVSLAQVDRDKAVAEMLQAIEDGRLVASPAVAARLRDVGTNWQDLTVEELRGMRDIVRQLEHQAKTKAEMVVNDEKVLFEEAETDIVESMLEQNKKIDFGVGEPTTKEGIKESVKKGVHHALSVGSIARILDAGHWGALTRRIAVPIRRANTEKLIPRIQQYQEDMAELYQKHYSDKELGNLSKKRWVQGMQQNLSKSDILSIALHMGSDSNREALFGGILKDENNEPIGPAYPEQGVRAVLATMDARDWAFVQDVWDYLDSYWPEASAAEQRRRGISPQKIEAKPFTVRTSDGKEVTLRGGYMRLYYDRRFGKNVKADEIEDYRRKMGNGVFVTSTTRAGSTYERVKNHGKVVRLGLGGIDQHLREVIRDISIGDEVNFVARLLDSPKVEAAFQHTGNEIALDELNLWLTDAAVGELPAQNAWEKLFAYTRTGFIKSKLGFSSTVTLLQLTGVFQSMALIGKKSYMMGFGKFMQNPAGQYKYVMNKSKAMNTRYGVMQSYSVEVADAQSSMRSIFGPIPTKFKRGFDRFSHYYFWTIMKMQSVVDTTTWLGAYWKGRNVENLSDSDAVLYADSLVEGAQTSGIFAERTGLERGTLGTRTRQSQGIRLWTTLIGYMLRKIGLAYEATGRFKKNKTVGGAVELAFDFMLLFMIEGIASQLIYGNWPGDGDDDEVDAAAAARWVAVATGDSVIAGIPIVREIASARYGSGNTPLGSVTNDMFKLAIQASQGEADEQAIKAFVNVIGTTLHLPSSQVNRAIGAYMSEDPELYEYIMGPARDE